jgi:hypothetical protein
MLQVSDTTASAAHAAARARTGTALQSAYAAARARAKKVASREPHLITSFTLSDEIEQIRTQAQVHFQRREVQLYVSLNLIADRLQKLIP